MYEAGKDHLVKNYTLNPLGYRFGFHSPGHNSQEHLHMHCLALPLKYEKYEKRYGTGGLKIYQDLLEELSKRQEVEDQTDEEML